MKSLWNNSKRVYMFWLNKLRSKSPSRPALPESVVEYFQQSPPPKQTPIEQLRFVALDTETTGLQSKSGDRILSIGAVGIKQLRIDLSDSFFAALNPERASLPETVKVHLITPEESRRAPAPELVIPKLLAFIGADVILGHHIRFDKAFLDNEICRLYGKPLYNAVVDTAELAYALDAKLRSSESGMQSPQEQQKYALDTLAQRYGIDTATRHDAWNDALCAAQLGIIFLKKLSAQGVRTLADLQLLTRTV